MTSSINYYISSINPPKGKIKLSGSKHVAFRCLVASLLTSQQVEIQNFPNDLLDVEICIALLKSFGKNIRKKKNRIIISGKPYNTINQLDSLDASVRVTTLMLGPLLAWYKKATVPYPGGCKIGKRPIDLHKMVLERLGAKVEIGEKYVHAHRHNKKLCGARIFLPLKSNGAGECAILAGCLAKGTTIIEEAHITPELIDFINFLKSMGAKIVLNSSNVIITGVTELHSTKYKIMNDIVEGITYVLIATLTGGHIEIYGLPLKETSPLLQKLEYIGANFEIKNDIIIVSPPKRELGAFKITAGPYPQLYSDMQPLFTVLGLKCNGISYINDDRWPNRFTHVVPLKKMGANIKQKDNFIEIHGNSELKGTIVKANDIRCGMALLISSFISKGSSIIRSAEQIERGYEKIVPKLKSIGLNIKRFQIN